MALKSEKKAQKSPQMAEPERPLPKRPTRSGPSEADRWSTHAFVGTLVSWALLLIGQRVLETEEGLAKAVTGLAVIGLVLCLGQRVWAAMSAAPDRRAAARAFAILGGLGLLALVLYFAGSDWGREVLGVKKPSPSEPDMFGDIVTVAYVTLLSVTLLPTIMGELARRTMLRAERMESRRVIAAVVSGTAIGLAAAYGSLFTFVGAKLDMFVDFSYFRVAAPSDSTVRMLESMEEPLRVLVFFPPNSEVGKKVNRYLSDLNGRANMMKIEQPDFYGDPGLVDEHKVKENGVVVLVRDKMSEQLKIGVDEQKAAPKLKTLDGEFQKVLLQTLREKRTAYLTVGHGEMNESTEKDSMRSVSGLRELLENQHYGIKNLGLAEGLGREVPEDASIVFVIGPTQAFSDGEVDTLRRFADGGGKLFLALDADNAVNLAPLAEIVGVKWEQHLVLNDQVQLRMQGVKPEANKKILISTRFSSHPAVSTLSKNVARGANAVIFGGAPLDKIEGDTSFKIDFAIKSVAGSYVDLDGNWNFDKDTEKKETFNLAAAVTRSIDPAAEDDKKKKPIKGPAENEMRAWVMGDAQAFADPVIAQLQQNQLLFAEVVRWLGGEESFTGAISETEDVAIVHTKAEDKVWFYGAIIGVPGLVAGAGVFMTMRTRRRRRPEPAPRRSLEPDERPQRPAEDAPKKKKKKKKVSRPPVEERADESAAEDRGEP